MMAFTAVMAWDLDAFGEKMRKTCLDDAFGLQGEVVLVLLGTLPFAGGLLVGVRRMPGWQRPPGLSVGQELEAVQHLAATLRARCIECLSRYGALDAGREARCGKVG